MTDRYLPPVADPLTAGHRVESWWVDLLARDGTPLGRLDGLLGGSVEHNANRVIHGGGELTVDDTGQVSDWLDRRVRIWWQVEGVDPWPLGTFVCSTPSEQHASTGRTWRVDLLDTLSVLDADGVSGTLALPAGTVVTTAVSQVITGAGESDLAITPSTETLSAPMVWEAGTSRLRICNDLLASINYWSLRCDPLGRVTASPYTRPGDRSVSRDLTTDRIVADEWGREQDLAAVPNRVVLVSAGASDTPALVGVAENTDPSSRLSIPTRGRVITYTDTGVDATSQSVIDALAARRLADLSSPSATRTVDVAPVPISLHDVVRHDGARAAVHAWSLALEVGADMRVVMQEVTG